MKYATTIMTWVTGLLFLHSSWAADAQEEIKSALESLMGSALSGDVIEPSNVPGIYIININGSIYHALLQDQILLIGEAFDLERGVSLNDEINNQAIGAAVSDISLVDMIVFAAHEKKRHMTVFTDIDCGYCRRFHQEVPVLNAAGLEVRYMAFPRAGIGSSSYEKIVTVWCSEDPQQAMTSSKAGQYLEPLTCQNPVAKQYMIGQESGVRGTPTLVLDDGTVIGGYLPAEDLLVRIGLSGG